MRITTQAELTANIESGEVLELVAAGVFSVVLYGVEAPQIVVSHAGADLSVEAWESSQPRVVAWAYAQLSIRGAVQATCSANVSALIDGSKAKVEGGKQTFVQRSTPQEWCDYHGVVVSGEIALVYKAVADDYRSPHGGNYTPGTIPVAPDWDGGSVECGVECGGGLHFSPTPAMARAFFPEATRYLACPVSLGDIAVHPDGNYPEKIKARGCAAPVYEVDEDSEPVKAVGVAQ